MKRFFAGMLVIVLLLATILPVMAAGSLPQPGDALRENRNPGIFTHRNGFYHTWIVVSSAGHTLESFEMVFIGGAVESYGYAVLVSENGHRIYPIHEIFADGERLTFFGDESLRGMRIELFVQFRETSGTEESFAFLFSNGRHGNGLHFEAGPSTSPHQLSRPTGVGRAWDILIPRPNSWSSDGTVASLRVPRPTVLPTVPQEPIMGLAVNQPATPEAPSTWARDYVTRAIELGLVPQALQANYTQAITRAEFTALAVTLYEKQHGEITGRVEFDDTDDINVQKAAYIGVVQGVGDGRFDPWGTLTREQAATMLSRLAYAIGSPLPREAATFADNDAVSYWAIDAVGQVQAAGIMGGVGENRFNPQGAYTREQSIVTILRLFDFIN